MYGMVCSARARGKPTKIDTGDSDLRPAMSDTLRGLLDGVRARLPSSPRRATGGAQATYTAWQ